MVANALTRHLRLDAILVEPRNGKGKLQLLRRRAKRFGWSTVVGQTVFMVYAAVQRRVSKPRILQIYRKAGLDSTPAERIVRVPSANDQQTIELLRRLAPKVVVVNGTRILSKEVLGSVPAVFINTHSGITPKYRGVCGGYWAIANGDHQNAGVTVHLVDQGIDTGSVLYQAVIQIEGSDNYSTYPALQLVAGIPLLLKAVDDALSERLVPRVVDLPSRIHSHPTVWQYLRSRWRHGAR